MDVRRTNEQAARHAAPPPVVTVVFCLVQRRLRAAYDGGDVFCKQPSSDRG